MAGGTVPETMRAATIDGFGGVERLRVQRVPVPRIGLDDVLIRVEAAGVGSWDAQEREGQYDGAFGFESTFPYVLGWDGAGLVVGMGERVRRFRAGERVYAASMPLPRGGFYAEYAVVREDHVAPVPGRLTVDQAAAMPWDALTAVSGLDALGLRPGATLMIIGASGGIGHMALQLAGQMGLRVLAVASGEDGVALANRLGAEAAVDGRRHDVLAAASRIAPDGVDAALVTVGGAAVDAALMGLRAGALVACPFGVTPEPRVPAGRQLIMYNGDRSPAATRRLNELIDAGRFEVHVARSFMLDDVAEAHRALEAHYLGKLVLRVSG